MDVDEYLANLDARLPDGVFSPDWDPLTIPEQRKLVRLAKRLRAEVKRLELELRQAQALRPRGR